MPMLISPAYAQGTGMMDQSALVQFLPLVLIFVVFYFLLIRPQQKKQKEHRSMLDAVRRGDRVVTGGGILGTISRWSAPRRSRSTSPRTSACGCSQHAFQRAVEARPRRRPRSSTREGQGQGKRARHRLACSISPSGKSF
jgi:preprotein translocase YajC subunit